MPKIDVGVSATGLAKARSMTLSDGDVTRATTALKAFYGPKEDGTTLTDQEAWDRLFEGYRRSLVDIVRKVEAEAAKSSAEDSVADIAVS